MHEIELPWPGKTDQVLVRMEAAGVNPADTFFRALGTYIGEGPGTVLGHDGAGVVEAVGDDVTSVKVGDRVCFCNGGVGGDHGTYSRHAVVPEWLLAKIPRCSLILLPLRACRWCSLPPGKPLSNARNCRQVNPSSSTEARVVAGILPCKLLTDWAHGSRQRSAAAQRRSWQLRWAHNSSSITGMKTLSRQPGSGSRRQRRQRGFRQCRYGGVSENANCNGPLRTNRDPDGDTG